jgi:hypothetical protein
VFCNEAILEDSENHLYTLCKVACASIATLPPPALPSTISNQRVSLDNGSIIPKLGRGVRGLLHNGERLYDETSGLGLLRLSAKGTMGDQQGWRRYNTQVSASGIQHLPSMSRFTWNWQSHPGEVSFRGCVGSAIRWGWIRLAARKKIRTPVFGAASQVRPDHPCPRAPIGASLGLSCTPLAFHIHIVKLLQAVCGACSHPKGGCMASSHISIGCMILIDRAQRIDLDLEVV